MTQKKHITFALLVSVMLCDLLNHCLWVELGVTKLGRKLVKLKNVLIRHNPNNGCCLVVAVQNYKGKPLIENMSQLIKYISGMKKKKTFNFIFC